MYIGNSLHLLSKLTQHYVNLPINKKKIVKIITITTRSYTEAVATHSYKNHNTYLKLAYKCRHLQLADWIYNGFYSRFEWNFWVSLKRYTSGWSTNTQIYCPLFYEFPKYFYAAFAGNLK